MKKNIIFDAGGVLFYINEFRNDILRRVLDSTGYSSVLIEEGIESLREFDSIYFESNEIITWKDEKDWLLARASHLAEAIDTSSDVLADKVFMLTFDSFQYNLYDETITILESLSDKYNLYVLSNATASLDWAFDYLGIRKYFKEVIISSYTGMNKPNQRIYEYALGVVGASEDSCFFVDDRIENIEASIECGIKAFHLNRKAGMTLSDFVKYIEKTI